MNQPWRQKWFKRPVKKEKNKENNFNEIKESKNEYDNIFKLDLIGVNSNF